MQEWRRTTKLGDPQDPTPLWLRGLRLRLAPARLLSCRRRARCEDQNAQKERWKKSAMVSHG
jgi:hypothetical protein